MEVPAGDAPAEGFGHSYFSRGESRALVSIFVRGCEVCMRGWAENRLVCAFDELLLCSPLSWRKRRGGDEVVLSCKDDWGYCICTLTRANLLNFSLPNLLYS